MKTAKIYTLSDPKTLEIRYVGKTEKTLKERLNYHIWDIKRTKNKHKINWLNSLIKKNLKPEIRLIEEVPFNEWKFWEKYWISQFKIWGFNLLNYHEGGEGYSSEDVKKLWKNKKYREFHTNRVKGNKNPFFGKKHNDETKQVLREKCPKRGEEHGCFGRVLSNKEKKEMRLAQPTLKEFIRLDLDGNIIDEWKGLKFMCRELDLDEAAVIRVAKGKVKTHKNFIFKYKN